MKELLRRRLAAAVLLAVAIVVAPVAEATTQYPTGTPGESVGSIVGACINGAGQASPCSSVEVCQPLTVTASSAYASGNEIGALITVTIPALAAGQLLVSIRMDFKDAQTAEFDVYQFSANPSASTWTDKTNPAINAADVFKALPPIKLTTAASALGTHTVYGQDQIARALARASATDYFVIVAIGTPTFASAADAEFCAAYL